MKKSLFFAGLLLCSLLFCHRQTHAQCPNLNLSMGNFINWQGYTGTCHSGAFISPSIITLDRHTIMNRSQLLMTNEFYDEYCSTIKKIPDGFQYAARLGNSNAGAEMEALEYTMTIDSTNSLLIVHFAWVMQDPSHFPAEQPNFKIEIRNSAGNPLSHILPCGDTEAYQGLACYGDLIARDWTIANYNLTPYIGQTIKLYIETRDCTLNAHFGYAYFVAECRPWSIDLTYCGEQTAVNLTAPHGYGNYTWTRSSDSLWVRSGNDWQNLILSDPVEDEVITCEMSSGGQGDWGLGNCSDTLHRVIKKTIVNADFAMGTMENGQIDTTRYDTCRRTVTLVDRSTVTNSKKSSVRWQIDGLNLVISDDSVVTLVFPVPVDGNPVTYEIRLRIDAENGCSATSIRYITVYPSYYLELARVDSIHAHFTSQQELHCNYTDLTFTNNSFADIEVLSKVDCRINPDTNIYLNCHWDWGDGTFSNQRIINGTVGTIKKKYSLPNTETRTAVKLTVKIDGTDTMVVYTDTLTILPRPTAAFTDDGHVFSSCSEPEDGSNSRNVRFTNQSQGNIERLIWNFGDGNELSGSIDDSLFTNPTHAYPNSAGKYDILLIAVDSNQCVDSLIKQKHVTVLGVKGDFSYTPTNTCAPISVIFTSVLNNDDFVSGFHPDSIVFVTGDGGRIKTIPPAFSSRTRYYANAGDYLPSCLLYKTITYNGENELCVQEIKGRDSIRVVDLIPDFDILGHYLVDSQVVFTNTSIMNPEEMPYDSLMWDFGNGDVSYDFDGRTTFGETGEYTVVLKMKMLECIKQRTRTIKVIKETDLPVSDRNAASSILLYPNPASTQLHVEHSFEGEAIFSIYNILGQIVLKGQLQEGKSSIDIESLAKGVYHVKIAGKETVVVKFVKD